MNSFWDQELKARKAVFFKQYRNAILNGTFNEELHKEKLEIRRRFLPAIKEYENEEKKQIKLELAKVKVKAQLKLQDIYKRRQLEIIKNMNAEITNYVAEPHPKELTEKLSRHWEECKSTEARMSLKVKWLKKIPQNLSHERSNENKMKERNPLKEQQKRKPNK